MSPAECTAFNFEQHLETEMFRVEMYGCWFTTIPRAHTYLELGKQTESGFVCEVAVRSPSCNSCSIQFTF